MAETTENKVIFGLKGTHYALVTEGADGTYTYGTPKPLPGATEISLDTKGETSEFYADDTVYYSSTSNQGYDGTLTIANIPNDFRTDVLGETFENGVLTENANAKPKKIALMFEFDGDVKAIRHVLYNCSVARPGTGSSTKSDTVEPNTVELSFTASPRNDGVVKRSTTAAVTEDIYNSWYTTVFNGTPTV